MRLAQVKAWIDGQAWFDLRQHKLYPPDGFNIHWTRIVDLPIAALMLIFTPIVGSFHRAADRLCGRADVRFCGDAVVANPRHPKADRAGRLCPSPSPS